ncbi:MAG: hypothetical protein JSW27_09565 [Phycisphaerales bacterium]|nr:MAG: hypothetical protein JSW27_09565 [Phycisphaerales bacterium]
MKRLIALTITICFLLGATSALAHTADVPFITDLTAGGGNPESAIDVGDVEVWNDGDDLFVRYVLDNPVDPDDPQVGQWCLSQTHLAAEQVLADVPQTKNNSPIPGLFPYGDEILPSDPEATYAILDAWAAGTELYIAAHAEVQEIIGFESDVVGFNDALPDQVTMSVEYPYGGGPAYFPTTTVTGGTSLDGTYLGWCVDTDNVIYQNTPYTVNVYSSYETLPDGLIEYPENLDKVNYIINQGYVGQPSPTCGGNYTYGDVQRAIWALVEDNLSTSGLGPWSQCRVDEILAAASANGEGYVPPCGGVFAVILAAVSGQQVVIAQVTTIEVEVPCVPVFDDETAWGGPYPETRFNDKDWSIYFTYTVQDE